jgi:hypothetical protein
MHKRTREVITLGGRHDAGQEERFHNVFAEVCRVVPGPYEGEGDDVPRPAAESTAKPAPVAPRKSLPR